MAFIDDIKALRIEFAGLGWGKKLARRVYYNRFDALPATIQSTVRRLAPFDWNSKDVVIRLEPDSIAVMVYSDIDNAPHPVAVKGVKVTADGRIDWKAGSKVQIIHRKEMMHPDSWPGIEEWKRLSLEEEKAGLFEHPCKIGYLDYWKDTLDAAGVRIENNRVVRR